jgi:hypothetical protein
MHLRRKLFYVNNYDAHPFPPAKLFISHNNTIPKNRHLESHLNTQKYRWREKTEKYCIYQENVGQKQEGS